jgi:hypothetical protein
MRYAKDDWNISAGGRLYGTEVCHENQGIHAKIKKL